MNIGNLRGARYWQSFFIFTALLLLVNIIAALYSLSRVTQAQDAIQRALQVVMSVQATYSAIQDVEISERDFLLWKNDDALQVYRDSVATVVNEMLEMHTVESDTQAFAQLESLESLLLRRLRIESLETLEFPYAALPRDPLSWNIAENAELMRDIRLNVMAIKELYTNLIAERRDAHVSSERNIFIALTLVTMMGTLGMTLMYVMLQRSLSQQQRWESALLAQKQVLEDRVNERTAALQRKSQELERSNRELEDFAFIASHDLQEPLRKIQAFGDRLKGVCGPALGDNVDYLNRMQSAAARMSALVTDLLEISRASAKARVFETVSLDRVLADVLEDLGESIERSGANVVADALPAIEADATQMHQLFQNLIANAIKFSQAGQPPEVRISAKRVQPETASQSAPGIELLEIHVIDNGIGFEPEFSDRIFKPFQRLHSRSQYSGSGIGLALCRRIVERHNGSLTVSSAVGVGSDFTIELPTRHDADLDSGHPDTPAIETSPYEH